jgi:uncharacterized protein YciI
MSQAKEESPIELDRFELALLKRSTSSPPFSEEELEQLQARHIAHLQEHTRLGHIRVAGPVDEQPDESLRGLSIYQTGSLERARELASADPSVVAGRLELDVMFFYCPKGSI